MSDPKGYHPYVFDTANRRFVGAFEEMYRAEQREGFDSWHQDDLRRLTHRISADVLADYNFARVLDVGCGKGAFTSTLKRNNNDVVALDLSETALGIARARYPEIDFRQVDLAAPGASIQAAAGAGFDLAVCLETLSYLSRWRDVVSELARVARWTLIGLYIPDDPIGFVKSFDELTDAFGRSHRIVEDIRLVVRRQIVLFGEAR